MSIELVECDACGGLVPAGARSCLHCRRSSPFFARVIASGAALLTLMACYGAPPGYWRDHPTPVAPEGTDADGDGVRTPTDCNDDDASIYPGAADADGDGIDQSCDGVDGWRDPSVVAAPKS
ncbi:MAG TPA: putative metal-binding motif-containing protein [Kofleriaceae bacterium]|nr:putative metal-binding motif-containing protein [Kofleriaceae bacterium]